MLVTDELSVRSTAAEIRAAYEVWAADREAPPLLQRPFWTLLRDEALRRGAYPTVIDERRVYKGLRLAHLPPPAAAESDARPLVEEGSAERFPNARAVFIGNPGERTVFIGSPGDFVPLYPRDDAARRWPGADVAPVAASSLQDEETTEAMEGAASDARVAWARTLFWIATAACLAAAVWVSLSGR